MIEQETSTEIIVNSDGSWKRIERMIKMNDVIKNFKQELIAEIMRVYELEYPTASGDMDEFYHYVLNIIRNLRYEEDK